MDKIYMVGAHSRGRTAVHYLCYLNPEMHVEAYLYDKEGKCIEHFKDTVTQNGFTYEAQEVIDCIRAGKIQSETVPHSLTIACAENA